VVEQHLSLSLAQSESVYPSNTSLWPYVMPNVAVPLTYRKTPLAASQCAGIGVDMTRKPVNRLCDVRPGAHHQIHQTTFKCTLACHLSSNGYCCTSFIPATPSDARLGCIGITHLAWHQPVQTSAQHPSCTASATSSPLPSTCHAGA